jgi:hypothetical protein
MIVGTNWGQDAWFPSMFIDAVNNSNGGFTEYATSGNGPESGIANRTADGWPLEAWSIKMMECQTRVNPANPPTGAWLGECVWASTIGTLEAFGVGAISNVVTTGQVTTFTWTNPSTDPLFGLRGTQGITSLKLKQPGFALSSPQILTPDAIRHFKRNVVIRMINFLDLNSRENEQSTSWQTRQPDNKGHGLKGLNFARDCFLEVYNAPSSRTRIIQTNAYYKWSRASHVSFAQWMYSWHPAGMVWFPGGCNERWNSAYPKFSVFKQRSDDVNHPDYSRINTPAYTDVDAQWERYGRLWALDEARQFSDIRTVYGSQFASKVRCQMEGHVFGGWHRDRYLPWLMQPQQIAEFGHPNTYIYNPSCAPYPQGSIAQIVACSSSAELIEMLESTGQDSLSVTLAATTNLWVNALAPYSFPGGLNAYECNPEHITPNQGILNESYPTKANLIVDACRSPLMQAYTLRMLTSMQATGFRVVAGCNNLPGSYYAPYGNTTWAWKETWSDDEGQRSLGARAWMEANNQWSAT